MLSPLLMTLFGDWSSLSSALEDQLVQSFQYIGQLLEGFPFVEGSPLSDLYTFAR